jgi:Rod binding domain-containing protein
MSVPAVSGSPLSSGDLPVVSQTLEPAWVRKGSASTQKAYDTALAFEQMLVEQLSQSLTASSGLSGEGGEEGESSEGGSSGDRAAGGPISSMLPQALTSGVMNAGGLGLAAQMTRQLQGAAAATPAGTSDGISAATTGGTSATTPAAGGADTSANGGSTLAGGDASAMPAAGTTGASGGASASGGTSA